MTTTAAVHPNIDAVTAAWREELLKWVNVPGKVHVSHIVELRDGVPRLTLALGGHRKDDAIITSRIDAPNRCT